MRILITGASGFIGRSLYPLLTSGGHDVLRLGRNESSNATEGNLQADLFFPDSYKQQLKDFKPDGAIHLAWSGLPDYSLSNCHENLRASSDLFEALIDSGCKWIFSSGTCWEYGNMVGAAKETNQGLVSSLFPAFKLALHAAGNNLCKAAGIRFIWGRPFFVYGPNQRRISLIPSCYSSFREGTLPLIQNPNAVNDFIHVFDVAQAILALIKTDDADGIFNIGSGKPFAVWEVVNLVASLMDKPPIYCGIAAEPQKGLWADTRKITNISWQPSIPLKTGIAQAIELWKKENN